MKRAATAFVVLLVFFSGAGFVYFWWTAGVSNRDLLDSVTKESDRIAALVEKRSDAIELKCSLIEARARLVDEKLGRIEQKLDALIRFATDVQLPDEMGKVK